MRSGSTKQVRKGLAGLWHTLTDGMTRMALDAGSQGLPLVDGRRARPPDAGSPKQAIRSPLGRGGVPTLWHGGWQGTASRPTKGCPVSALGIGYFGGSSPAVRGDPWLHGGCCTCGVHMVRSSGHALDFVWNIGRGRVRRMQ